MHNQSWRILCSILICVIDSLVAVLGLCLGWRPQGDSNPRRRRERAMS